MKAYISVSYSKKKEAAEPLLAIVEALQQKGITPFVFVEQYTFDPTEERKMMQQAMLDIDACDLLIAETSEKAIGIGVEVGYAKAKNKPVIYVRHQMAEHSTTVAGISDYQIFYTNAIDLKKQLETVLTTFF
jgi:nucleoside 2-deoxyribosyltransferase